MARVLIVDDTDIVRKALEVAVRRMGHEAESTSDPRLAIELAIAHHPDLALLDYRMPGMSGAALFVALKKALGAECPKVLFVSATPAEDLRGELPSPDLALVGIVKKPFHLDDLARVVDEALTAPLG